MLLNWLHPCLHLIGSPTFSIFTVHTPKTFTPLKSPHRRLTSASKARLAQGLRSRISGTGHLAQSLSCQGSDAGLSSMRRHSVLGLLRWLSS